MQLSSERLIAIEKALISLGDSRDEVRDSLIRLGIKGHRMTNEECPIARYVRQHLLTDEERAALCCLEVSARQVRIHFTDETREQIVLYPTPIALFISEFDGNEEYAPELIEA